MALYNMIDLPLKRKQALYFISKYSIVRGRCLEYTKNCDTNGYARIGCNGKNYKLNRIIYKAMFGDVPINIFVCHTCDNPKCINPDHLVLGTCAWNLFDMDRKKRRHINIPPIYFGENNNKSKLKRKDIIKIRQLYKIGKYQYQIAKLYNVCQSTIGKIVLNKTWRNV